MHILELLSLEMKEPLAFQSLSESWFHYLSLMLMVIMMIWSTRYLKNKSVKHVKKYLLIFAVILIVLEIYKQIIYTYSNQWAYRWYAFPFQFCSVPMYVGLIIGLTKNNKIYQIGTSFLATYGLFAGIAVMFYPIDAFVTTIGINIQTMIHHGGIAVVGFSLIFSKQVSLKLTTLFKGSIMFSIVIFIAILLNWIHNTWIFEGSFNMFFINPKYENNLPILSGIQPLVPSILFIVIYYVGFSLVAGIVFKTITISSYYVEKQLSSLEKKHT
jgi:hypothetical protein